MKASTVATPYPRHGDFVSLQERLDPRGAFRNEWLQSQVLGTWAGVGRHPA
jgi:xylitol oxidase